MTILVRPSVVADVDGLVTVKVSGGRVSLDALAIPYGTANVELPLAIVPELEDLDPRADTRIRVTAADAQAGTSRTFDLGLRYRTLTHDGKSVHAELATDEALLTDYAALTPDATPRQYEDSVRSLVNYVLTLVGGNIVPVPIPTSSLEGWGATNQGGSPVGTLTFGYHETHRARATLAGGAPTYFGLTAVGAPVVAGRKYSAKVRLRASKSTNLLIAVEWHNATGSYLGGGGTKTMAGTEGTLAVTTSAAPAGAVEARIVIRINKTEPVGTWIESDYAAMAEGPFAPFILEPPEDPGMPDDAVPAAWDETNRVLNPSFETDTLGTAASSNAGSFAIATPHVTAPAGVRALRVTVPAAGTSAFYVAGSGNTLKAEPGKVYRYTVRVLSATAGRVVYPFFVFRDTAGAGIGANHNGASITSRTDVWTEYSVVATAPALTASIWLGLNIAGNTAGQLHYADAVLLVEDSGERIPYFDGATADDGQYVYEWTGTAHASTSTRDALEERPQELYVWDPGETAWDFLEAFTSSVGLRLYCDELRAWRLILPSEYEVPGLVSLATSNVSGAADTISREDADVFATGVVVKYRWRDAKTGETREAYDSAGTPHKVFVLEYDRPYPGPGAAASILRRRDGTGRTQETTALANLTTTPGMEAVITLSDAPLVRGKVSSVVFDLTDGLLMVVGTRGLIDLPGDAWDAGPDVVTWSSAVGTWDTFTWEAQP